MSFSLTENIYLPAKTIHLTAKEKHAWKNISASWHRILGPTVSPSAKYVGGHQVVLGGKPLTVRYTGGGIAVFARLSAGPPTYPTSYNPALDVSNDFGFPTNNKYKRENIQLFFFFFF